MASCSSFLLTLVLLLALVAANCFKYSDRPIIDDSDESKQFMAKPWIAVDHNRLTTTLANTTGFRIASAVLQQHPLISLLLVKAIYTDSSGTKLFIPNCDAITIYIRPLENEMEILQNNPGIIDELKTSQRFVFRQLLKKVSRFDGGGNVSVSRPFLYSDDEEEGRVVVHGTDDKGFGAVKRQIINLGVYPPLRYIDEYEGVLVGGDDGFQAMEYPIVKEAQYFIEKLKTKIEMVIVANIVPTPHSVDYDPDSVEWIVLSAMYGSPEKAVTRIKEENMPYKFTMLYTMHF